MWKPRVFLNIASSSWVETVKDCSRSFKGSCVVDLRTAGRANRVPPRHGVIHSHRHFLLGFNNTLESNHGLERYWIPDTLGTLLKSFKALRQLHIFHFEPFGTFCRRLTIHKHLIQCRPVVRRVGLSTTCAIHSLDCTARYWTIVFGRF